MYAVMSAEYCGESVTVSPVFAETGLIDFNAADGREYLLRIRNKYSVISENLKNSSDGGGELLAESREIIDYIDKCLKETGNDQ